MTLDTADARDPSRREFESLLAEREGLREQLVEQAKLASLGGVAAGIAHEVRNPLHFVHNFSEMVLDLSEELGAIVDDARDRMPADTIEDLTTLQGEIAQAARKIIEHSQRVDGIVKSMHLDPGGSSTERHLTDVNELVSEAAEEACRGLRARNAVGSGVALTLDLDDRIVPISVAPHSLYRAVGNVVANACEAADASDTERAPVVQVATRYADDAIEIEVSDTGAGISDGDRPHVFEPFFTTKPARENTGLGLAQVWEIVTHDHAGTVEIETTGAGTTVTLVLPVVPHGA
jgi:signal transduction histidine kinase